MFEEPMEKPDFQYQQIQSETGWADNWPNRYYEGLTGRAS